MKGRPYHAHPDLAEAVRAAAARARETGRVQWVCASREVQAVDALGLFAANDASGERFYWELPARDEQAAAFGAVHAFEHDGPGRFDAAAVAAHTLRDDLHAAPVPGDGRTPLLVGAFAFDDADGRGDWTGFPAARLVLPASIFHRRGTHASFTVHRAIAADDEPAARVADLERALAHTPPFRDPLRPPAGDEVPGFDADAGAAHARFLDGVERALDAIAAGDLEKVVLARSVRLRRRGDFDPAEILATLRRTHPSCVSFAFGRGASVFLGATPERLLDLDGRRIETAAVAGSAPRGRNPVEDADRARELRESKKEQAEHAAVVRALRDALEPVCAELEVAEAPRLLQLDGIQHLETPIAGLLREEASLLELAGRLHPTPAVGGTPREAALAWLDRNEPFERGWYAGPLGIVRRDGGGELWVALRSALLRGESAHLFAGAGIVSGARPESELRETQLKLRTMLDALVDL